MLFIIAPFVVLEMNVITIAPFVVVGVVSPLESLHGLPYEHENHISHPLHHIAFVCFALIMLTWLLEVICSFFI
jgi:hypothetical protein